MAAALDRLEDYRVLRRLEPYPAGPLTHYDPTATRVGCAIDVETSGLDYETDAVIELCVQRFRLDDEWNVVEVDAPYSWLEDPGRPLAPEIVRITRLDDLDLVGERIDDALAAAIIGSADFVVAHNAGFDRPFVERRLPTIAGMPWACSLTDVDWRASGREGRTLAQLLAHEGWFHTAHRAEADVLALIRLLGSGIDANRTVLDALLANAVRPTWLISASGAPFAAQAALKARRYRWNASARCWEREMRGEEVDGERAWLADRVYEGVGRPLMRKVTWRERYATR
jgi:DNA polymerase-3 subunit epsilon